MSEPTKQVQTSEPASAGSQNVPMGPTNYPEDKENKKKKPSKNTTIIAAQDVVVLKALKYDDLVACENFLRAANATTHEEFALNKWIPDATQFLIDQKYRSSDVNKEEW
eukprot:CAMPEP_0170355812 /NCGR_PEP_ID=MMETSP0117_2-20130122/842_1 /TAXON_ID=400756 /ORGANISM="Durinskia baltica, Strain CSIRO CS-38" /LENGTH=108 /DNA_ID=CAMNT_0010609875 /DNA_START=71 /DNA_END=394 /DNA_ORIENTATION=+